MATSKLSTLLFETAVIYHIGILRMGVAQIILGLVSFACGGALMGVNQGAAWAGLGIFAGLPIPLAGVICLYYRKRRPRAKISLPSVFCLTSMVCAMFLVFSAGANIAGTISNARLWYPEYILWDVTVAPLHAINSVLLVASLTEVVVSAWASAITMGIICPCCNPAGDNPVWTIPYGEIHEDQEPVLEWDPEFTIEALSDDKHIINMDSPGSFPSTFGGPNSTRPRLQLQTDSELYEDTDVPTLHSHHLTTTPSNFLSLSSDQYSDEFGTHDQSFTDSVPDVVGHTLRDMSEDQDVGFRNTQYPSTAYPRDTHRY